MRKLVIFSLSLLGLFDSIYLFWVYTSPSHPMVCLGTGCDAVRASVYARAWGLPLPIYGVAMYAALALMIFLEPWVGRTSRALVATIAGAGFLTSLYLTGLEAVVIHAWCAWCVVSALTITLIFALALWDLRAPAEAVPGGGPGTIPPAPVSRRSITRMIAAFVVAVAVGIPAFYYLSHHGESAPPPPVPTDALGKYLLRPDSHAIGNPEAPVTVVEFGDFECRACGYAQSTVQAVRKQYGDRIRLVFRQLPLPAVHPAAEKAAEASECAADQGKFWEMVDKLYAEQNNLSESALIKYAGELGLDQKRFKQCLASRSTSQRVKRDIADAHALGFRATPTFVVGSRVVLGPMNFNQFAQLIDRELSSRKVTNAETAPGEQRSQGASGTGHAAAHPANSSPLSPPASSNSPGTVLGGGSTNSFSQFGGTAGLACSEDEAAKKQPALIRTGEARRLSGDSSHVLFVDVRPGSDYTGSHIKGAINIPVEQIEQRWSSLPKEKTIIFYESGKGRGDDICAAGRAAGRVLLEHGFDFERVKVYQDGLLDWEKSGLPVDR